MSSDRAKLLEAHETNVRSSQIQNDSDSGKNLQISIPASPDPSKKKFADIVSTFMPS